VLQPVVQEHLKKPCPNPIEEDLAASRTESEPSGTSEIAKNLAKQGEN